MKKGRERERERVSGEERVCKGLEKKKKERKKERKRNRVVTTMSTTSMWERGKATKRAEVGRGEGAASSSGSFLRVSRHPLPETGDPLLKGTTGRAEEED